MKRAASSDTHKSKRKRPAHRGLNAEEAQKLRFLKQVVGDAIRDDMSSVYKCRAILARSDADRQGKLTFYPVSRKIFIALVGKTGAEGGMRLSKEVLAKMFGKGKLEKGGVRDERYDASAANLAWKPTFSVEAGELTVRYEVERR